MKRTLITIVVLVALGGSGYAFYRYRQTPAAPTVATAPVTRGDIVDTVAATGTLQAVTTVQVGTQVSGTIESLYADFNSLVKKGQVLARLDPSLFQTQIEQAQANLLRAQADVERLRVGLEDARMKLARARELSNRQLIPQSDLETADVAVRSAEAQLRSSDAQVTQARASLNQNQVNLEHTVITAPIDGLVISRNVDVGQTVAASMQAPTLFVLAADLTKMQVVANLDESDVGRIRPGQEVSFRVDAYPTEQFRGAVSQVRLNPLVQQNVVTYATVIDVPNDELKLKPGMTANVNVEIARRMGVLRIANSTLRFRPTPEIYAALGLTAPDPEQRGGRGVDTAQGQSGIPDVTEGAGGPGGGRSGSTASPGERAAKSAQGPPSTADPTPSRSDRAGNAGGDRTGAPGGRGNPAGDDAAAGGAARRAARMQGLSPEQRDQMLQRMRARGGDPSAGRGNQPGAEGRGTNGRGRSAAPDASPRAAKAASGGATTIDALFGPLPQVETTGRAWRYTDKRLEAVRLRLGVSDGQSTELIEGNVSEGDLLVTNVAIGNETRPAAGAGGFPFGQPQRGAFPGGGFPAGGNRGGGGNQGRGR